MWARIDAGHVAELTDTDPAGRFHPSLVWRVATANVQPGWTYDGTVFAAPVVVAPPVVVPTSVTNFQARAALMLLPGPAAGATLFKTVDDALRAGQTADAAGLFAWQAWEQAGTFMRDGALIGRLAAGFGLDGPALDALFIRASAIEA